MAENYRAPVDSIGTIEDLRDARLYFIGTKRYAELFIEKIEKCQKLSNIGILLGKNVVEEIVREEPLWSILRKKVSWAGQVESIPLSMSLLSKIYYDQERETFNDEVDGRQMGTADIHPSAYIAQNVFIGANVEIGPGVRLHPGVVVLSCSSIGEECELFPMWLSIPRSSWERECVFMGERLSEGTVSAIIFEWSSP